MQVTAYKTSKIIERTDLFRTLDSIPHLKENDVVVITSKIVSICEGTIARNDGKTDKRKLIREESEYYMEEECLPKYGIILTIKNNTLIASSGIDESNGNGYFILWPKDPMKSATVIWDYLKKRDGLTHLGVIITDSHTTPMRWGTSGIGIAWCGFKPLKNYIETPDIFGRNLHMTQSSILDGISAAAVLVMGEGNEQTPLAVVRDAPFVEFQTHPPTAEEVDFMHISKEQDIYSPITNSKFWKKGGIT